MVVLAPWVKSVAGECSPSQGCTAIADRSLAQCGSRRSASSAPPLLAPTARTLVNPWLCCPPRESVRVAAGSLGGTMEACFLQPIDVIKTRLQLDHTGQYKGAAASEFRSDIDSCTGSLCRQQLSRMCCHKALLECFLDRLPDAPARTAV